MFTGLLLPAVLAAFSQLSTNTTISSLICSQPPPVTITTPVNHSVVSDNPITVSGSAEAGASYTVMVNGKSSTTSLVPISGYYSRAVDFPLGANQLQVKMIDSCGESSSSHVINFVRILAPQESATSQTNKPLSTPLVSVWPVRNAPTSDTSGSTNSSNNSQPTLSPTPASQPRHSPPSTAAKPHQPTDSNDTKTAWIAGASTAALASLVIGAKWLAPTLGFRGRKF